MIDFKAEAEAMREKLIALRRDFHQHPELAFQEVRTSGIVADELRKMGMEVQTGVGKTGVVAILEGDKAGPTVLVRADMDALPIHEENKTDYVSQFDGKMHACGHDGHTAIALGVAQLFVNHKENLKGRIKFVFQPAEEIGSGATAMIKDGVLENPRPDVSLGLHLWNTMPLGVLGVADGPVMAGSSSLTMTITGKGGHAAIPHDCIDPVPVAAQIILALQTIVSRNISPQESAVVSITKMSASHADNIIPEQVTLGGTMRFFRVETRDLIEKRIREIATGIATGMNCTIEFQFHHATIPVINNPNVSAKARETFKRIAPNNPMVMQEPTTGGEDMSLLMNDIPGMFFFVGSANEERGLNYGHHHPKFDFDEDVLPLSVALLASAVADYVIES
ncbi:MAG: M20 family metallopeptidase [bacterium]|nr:M20 family metallopeptidase [bacterium]